MRFLLTIAFVAIALGALSLSSGGADAAGAKKANPCKSEDISVREKIIIVVLQDDANVNKVLKRHEKRYDMNVCFVYRYALKGYAAHIDPRALPAIATDPDVLFVDEENEDPSPALQPRPPVQPEQPPQVVKNAMKRIGAEVSSAATGDGHGRVNINVAVIDDGIQTDHPDLNVVGAINCLTEPRDDSADRGWHGTMVGGLIGALDNKIGIAGIAPGANLYGVRTMDEDGAGSTAEIMCGLDWVAGTRVDRDRRNDIAIVNMSLGGPEPDDGACGAAVLDAMHYAICGVVSLGVVPVVAAGNETADFADKGPATYGEALTATAMYDNDAQPGGLGGELCLEGDFDDNVATFSNYATQLADYAHMVAAPGVCMTSTYPGSLYAFSSGTSFATPVVAGTVALCIAYGPCAGLTPPQIIEKIVADATAYNTANPDYGYVGDPLRPLDGRYYGYLVYPGMY